jgi:ATP-binding cassette subfamily F protein 3
MSLPPDRFGTTMRIAADFGMIDPERPLAQLSPGELQKAALARVICSDADLLLLDEPTNYLDIDGLAALEYHLDQQRRRGAGVLLVTHDRALTDTCADETVLLTRERSYRVPGGATLVWGAREDDLQSRTRQAGQIRRTIQKLQADVQRRTTWAYRKEQSKRGSGLERSFIAKRAAKMAKRAKVVEQFAEKERQRLLQIKPFVPKRVHLMLAARTVPNRRVFSLSGAAYSYAAGQPLLEDVSFGASTRDKICLMGSNGSGKSTLLRLVTGTLQPTAGTAERNDAVAVAEVAQDLDSFFRHTTLIENFVDCPIAETEIRRVLGAVQIRQDKVHEPVESFSRGELMRAAIAKCLLHRAEFLILDEPTSHLDIESIRVLEDVLGEFDGGFLIVSHDRVFVAAVAETLYVIENRTVRLA